MYSVKPRTSVFFLLHCSAIVRQCKRNSNPLLIFQSITTLICNLNCRAMIAQNFWIYLCCTVLRSYRVRRKISKCTKLKSLYECIVSDSRCQFYSWMPWLGRADSSTWCKVQSQSLCAMPLRQWPHQLYPPRSNQELSKTKVRLEIISK